MKLFIGIVVAAAAPFALSACGGGDDIAPVAAQHPENLAIWTALGGDSAAPGVVAGVVNAAVAGLLADPVEAPYFAAVSGNASHSSAAHDTPARLEACLTLQFSG